MNEGILGLAVSIVAAYVRNNSVPVADLPNMIRSVHSALGALQRNASGTPDVAITGSVPFVSIKSSVTPDYLVCLEDGKRLKMLKRYLRTRFNMTPDQYRKKWNLPSDYPMVAPEYAVRRSSIAKGLGLGRIKKQPKKRKPR